jgi:hypothetical protein
MSQRCVESLLGRILTDDEFRKSFFPIGPASFELAAGYGLELTPVERSALSSLQRRRFDFIAQSLDPRISRSASAAESAGQESRRGVDPGSHGSTH